MIRTAEGGPATPRRLPDWVQPVRSAGLLSRLADAVVFDVIAGAKPMEYPAGSISLSWDETPKAALLVRGSARTFLTYQDGSQVTTRYLRPGDLTGVFAPRQPRIARGVQALEPSQLLLIEAERVRQLAAEHPTFAWALIEELTTSLNSTQRALYIWAFGTVRQRVANTMVERARLAGPLAAGQSIVGTQAELAAATGTAREVVATVLQGFKRQGVVEVRRGSIVVVDPEQLAREADGGL